MIDFNRSHLTGKETHLHKQANRFFCEVNRIENYFINLIETPLKS